MHGQHNIKFIQTRSLSMFRGAEDCAEVFRDIPKAELLSTFGQLCKAAGRTPGQTIRELSKFNNCYTYRVAQKSLDNVSNVYTYT